MPFATLNMPSFATLLRVLRPTLVSPNPPSMTTMVHYHISTELEEPGTVRKRVMELESHIGRDWEGASEGLWDLRKFFCSPYHNPRFLA